MSKVEVRSNPKATKNNYVYGRLIHMAPKTLKNKFQMTRMWPFKVDLNSLAKMCFKLLS